MNQRVLSLARLLLSGLLGLLCLSCAGKREVIIVGERRDPLNDCQTSFVEHKFRVNTEEDITLILPKEWCAAMEGSPSVTCFLYDNNAGEWSYLELPKDLPHTEPADTHPDWICWQEEFGAKQSNGERGL